MVKRILMVKECICSLENVVLIMNGYHNNERHLVEYEEADKL